MQIEMTRDFQVAEDGVKVVLWAKGTIHETYEQLASDLIDAGVARVVAGHFRQEQEPKRRGRPPKDRA
jgi:hypothetical protein